MASFIARQSRPHHAKILGEIHHRVTGTPGSASAVAVPPSHGHGDAVLITLFLSHVLNYDKKTKGYAQ